MFTEDDKRLFQQMLKRVSNLPTEALEVEKYSETTGKVLDGEELTIEVSKVILKYKRN